MAGDAPAGMDHFTDAKATASAEVELEHRAGFESFEGAHMGIAQVVNMNIVANTCAVGR